MSDVNADIKTRYSIYVPKPLSRINLGDWQKRDGANFSPKFGYQGVSIQADQNLFFDIAKTAYLQTRGSFVAHASDWLQCSAKPMTLATGDNATVASDAVVTVVAGAGQSPTYTMDHGDALETVPYINLQLHYRIEEIQNSLFEFFRGRREKVDPTRADDSPALKKAYAFVPSLLKTEIEFDSRTSAGLLNKNPKGAKEGYWKQDKTTSKWTLETTDKDLRGGFEVVAERSWQELYGLDADNNQTNNKLWGYDTVDNNKLQRFAPHIIFDGIKDVRRDPDPNLHGDVDTNAGSKTKGLLKYGFSAYFSRFDPYLLYDPEEVAADPKLAPLEKRIVKVLAKLSNIAVTLKRCTDVLYKLGSILRDNAVMKVVQNALGAVDGMWQPVKALRSNLEVIPGLWLQPRSSFYGQVADEALSGAGKRGQAMNKQWAAQTTTKAVVRSIAPYKDPTAPAASANKGFYGGQQVLGGGYILPGGTQLKDGDQIHIKAKASDGSTVEFDTPPLVLGATSTVAATAAVIAGATAGSAWSFATPPTLSVAFDGGTATTIDLGQIPGWVPSITGGTGLPAAGSTLTLAIDGTSKTYTFAAADVANQTALVTALSSAFTTANVQLVGGALTIGSKNGGPGASVQVFSDTPGTPSSAAAALGLTAALKSGPTGGTVLAYVAGKVTTGGSASVSSNVLTLTSATKGANSAVKVDDGGTGLAGDLGLGPTSATGTAATTTTTPKKPEDVTADDLVALWSTVFNTHPEYKKAVAFTSEDGSIVITSQWPPTGTSGGGSFVEVSSAGPNGDNMKTSLQFLGDFRGESDADHVQEAFYSDNEDFGAFLHGLDDFDKLDTELQKLPDDAANVLRPVVVLGKNALGMVTKAVNVVKAIVKVANVKLPTAKGSIGLIANKGISLGTQDRIVGVGGQGIVFVADGGTGNPDHAKYVLLEDTMNKVTGADLFQKWEQPKDAKASLGFRVFSDTTADLVARNTAHVLALGRDKNASGDVVGSGVVRVAGSYGVDIAGREKVVIGARDSKLGRVEVLGATVAIGYTQVDINDQKFGLEARGAAAGWPNVPGKVELASQHAQTAAVLVHSTEQASIVVGEYMVQLRGTKNPTAENESLAVHGTTLQITQGRVTQCQQRVDQLTQEGVASADVLNHPNVTHYNGYQDWPEVDSWEALGALAAELDLAKTRVLTTLLAQAQQDLVNAQATHQAAQQAASIDDEGIIISMRDPADIKNKAMASWAQKSKPSIVLNKKGVTITTMTGQDDDAASARIVLDQDGVSIAFGKKNGVKIANDRVQLTMGDQSVALTNDGQIQHRAQTLQFSASQKISLG